MRWAAVLLAWGCAGKPVQEGSADSGRVGSHDSAVGTQTSTSSSGSETPHEVGPCDRTREVVRGVLTSDQRWTDDRTWVLEGVVTVGQDGPVELLLEAGVCVLGDVASGGRLVVSRGSRLIAEGTSDAPVVFTSSAPEGSRAAGDWGGIALHGAAPTNGCASDVVPDTTPCEVPHVDGAYGGDDAEDSSGALRFVRVAFAGAEGKDLVPAGVSLRGVGSATAIEDLHVHRCVGDGVHVLGGSVGLRRVMVTGALDDGIDWRAGWVGWAQYLAIQQFPGGAGEGLRGENLSDEADALPRSAPVLVNVTIAGDPEAKRCVHLREGTAGQLVGLVATGCTTGSLDVDHDETLARVASGALTIQHATLDVSLPWVIDPIQTLLGFDVTAWFLGQAGNAHASISLRSASDVSAPDLRVDGDPGAMTTPDRKVFEEQSERGAFPLGEDWTAWMSWPSS